MQTRVGSTNRFAHRPTAFTQATHVVSKSEGEAILLSVLTSPHVAAESYTRQLAGGSILAAK